MSPHTTHLAIAAAAVAATAAAVAAAGYSRVVAGCKSLGKLTVQNLQFNRQIQ
eukprot:COSAG01_NODE_3247_length_6356_cov_29.609397_6_plen_53_part_00